MGCINGKGFEDIRDGFHSHTCKCGSCPVSLGLGHKPWRVSFQCNSLLQSVMQSCCGELSPSSNAAPQTTGRAVAIQSGARAYPSVELRSKWRSFAGQIGGMSGSKSKVAHPWTHSQYQHSNLDTTLQERNFPWIRNSSKFTCICWFKGKTAAFQWRPVVIGSYTNAVHCLHWCDRSSHKSSHRATHLS